MTKRLEVERVLERLEGRLAKSRKLRDLQRCCRLSIGVCIIRVILGTEPVTAIAIALVFVVIDALLNRAINKLRAISLVELSRDIDALRSQLSVEVAQAEALLQARHHLTTLQPVFDSLDAEGEIGSRQCRYSARSALLRCAVNPQGPCEGCRHFQARFN